MIASELFFKANEWHIQLLEPCENKRYRPGEQLDCSRRRSSKAFDMQPSFIDVESARDVTDIISGSSRSNRATGIKSAFKIFERRLTMVARCQCDKTANYSLTFLVAFGSKKAVLLQESMIVTQCTASSDILRFMHIHGNSVSMAKLYEVAETKEWKLKLHCTLAKNDVSKRGKNCIEQLYIRKKACQ